MSKKILTEKRARPESHRGRLADAVLGALKTEEEATSQESRQGERQGKHSSLESPEGNQHSCCLILAQ